ncbi:MAG: alpha-galactosidase [Microbacteriaceae bacterium]
MPLLHLRSADTSLVVATDADSLPAIVHWGADLGDLDGAALEELARATATAGNENTTWHTGAAAALIPLASAGWSGRPGVLLSRGDGSGFAPRLADVEHVLVDDDGARQLTSSGTDAAHGLRLSTVLRLERGGLLRLRATLENIAAGAGADRVHLDELVLALPVPESAEELEDMTGRHLRERMPQRTPFAVGSRLRESWEGRPGHDAATWLIAGRGGFSARAGLVHGIHLAWSGNYRLRADRTFHGDRRLAGGELLLPGEIRLAPGEGYSTPWLVASWGEGLDALSDRAHAWLRARPAHPRGARPVILNTWEAVYFDHDLQRLRGLARLAADVGIERFVLDDGWFLGRRHDRAGLGDWEVDAAVWPDGLDPLVEEVHALGMQFGMWFEPEMVNPDSELARRHPDWVLGDEDGHGIVHRHQRVLDLSAPGALEHILERIDAVVDRYRVEYIKWDHNSPLVGGGHVRTGSAAVHEQVLALYALMDELRRRHPGLEIESCASGGGRVDLGIIEHSQRVWPSDCIDAHERIAIQEGTLRLLPPELVGTHIGGPVAHTTGRRHELDFRAAVAFFGHLGVEWDLATASPQERERLRAWIALHKAHRPLLHSGRVVNAELPAGEGRRLSGVVGTDRGEAIYLLAAESSGTTWSDGPLPLPGLDAATRYRVRPLMEPATGVLRPAGWMTPEGVVLPGRVLAGHGIAAPGLAPDTAVLVHAERVG